jgi:hypothetical protein
MHQNNIDFVSLEIPLLIRILEFAFEDATNDMELHELSENIISLSNDGQILSMSSYNDIIHFKKDEIDTSNMNSIDEIRWSKLAGII